MKWANYPGLSHTRPLWIRVGSWNCAVSKCEFILSLVQRAYVQRMIDSSSSLPSYSNSLIDFSPLIMVQLGRINKTKTDLIGLEMHCRSHGITGLFMWRRDLALLGLTCSTKITTAHMCFLELFTCVWSKLNSSENVSVWALVAPKWPLRWFLSRLLRGHKHKGHLEEKHQQEANSKVNTFCNINFRSLTTWKAYFKVTKIHIFFSLMTFPWISLSGITPVNPIGTEQHL